MHCLQDAVNGGLEMRLSINFFFDHQIAKSYFSAYEKPAISVQQKLEPVFTDDLLVLRAALELHNERLARGLEGQAERVLAPVVKLHL
jgi:hypothetical protein